MCVSQDTAGATFLWLHLTWLHLIMAPPYYYATVNIRDMASAWCLLIHTGVSLCLPVSRSDYLAMSSWYASCVALIRMREALGQS
jgi:hypothetical protein